MLPNAKNLLGLTKATWLWFVEYTQMSAFVTVGLGGDALSSYRNMIACAGIGALTPNTVVAPFRASIARGGRHRAKPDYMARVNAHLDQQSAQSGKRHFAKVLGQS